MQFCMQSVLLRDDDVLSNPHHDTCAEWNCQHKLAIRLWQGKYQEDARVYARAEAVHCTMDMLSNLRQCAETSNSC